MAVPDEKRSTKSRSVSLAHTCPRTGTTPVPTRRPTPEIRAVRTTVPANSVSPELCEFINRVVVPALLARLANEQSARAERLARVS